MISWAESEVFSRYELRLYRRATLMVEAIKNEPNPGTYRCHEIARAVGHVLELDVQDGHYLNVEHSWLWMPGRFEYERILDTYAVGRLPQVQLIDTAWKLPHALHYRWQSRGVNRKDIRQDVVDTFIKVFEALPQNGDV